MSLPSYVKVFDAQGYERTHEELEQVYGAVTVRSNPTTGICARIMELHERADPGQGFPPLDRKEAAKRSMQVFGARPEAPSTFIVTCQDKDGNALGNMTIAFYWDDAPDRPGSGCEDKAVIGKTNADGNAGFGMGEGAYYQPDVKPGPHRSWLDQIAHPNIPTDCLEGIGMLWATNHSHLDAVVKIVVGDPNPPGNEPDIDGALEDLRGIIQVTERALDLLDRSTALARSAIDKLLG